jgi:hypothetical protein
MFQVRSHRYSEKSLHRPIKSWSLSPIFSSSNFIVLNHKYISLQPFLNWFFDMVWDKTPILLFACGYPVYEQHLFKKFSFPHCVFLAPLVKISWPVSMYIYFWAIFSSIDLCVCFYASTMFALITRALQQILTQVVWCT